MSCTMCLTTTEMSQMSELGTIFGNTLASLLSTFNEANERSRLTELREDGKGEEWSAQLWQEIRDLDLPFALVKEEHGGVACTPLDVFEILRAASKHAPPVPLTEPMLAGWLLSSHDIDHTSDLSTIAHVRHDEERFSVEVTSDGLRVAGSLSHVYWGRHAQVVACVIEQEEQEIIVALPTKTARITQGYNLAGEPVDQLDIDEALDISATQYRIVSNGTWGKKLTHFAALCRCAQMAGAIESIFEMSLSYANQRHQFGRPIKRFQAIQHALAIMAGEVAAAVMATKAAFSAPTPWENTFEVAAAKSRVSQAALPITRIAHQVHAAIGFTAEYPLQLYTKRLWAWRDEFGNEMEWNERLGRLIIDSEQTMWEMLTQ
ncbi:MAG: acyl-CoA dehydrogenase family protein [Ardenticatenaceae bacterium]